MAELVYDETGRLLFTEEMRKDYTILIPQMLPVHFSIMRQILESYGYKCETLGGDPQVIKDTGLKYVHNDTCYPALLVIGQLITALQSGKYDKDKVALMITQTGGGCRASNYIGFIRRSLEKCGLGHVPVISLNMVGLEKNPGFKFTPQLIQRGLYALEFGDLFLRCLYRMRPYEKEKGSDRHERRCGQFRSRLADPAAAIRLCRRHHAPSRFRLRRQSGCPGCQGCSRKAGNRPPSV